MGKNSFIFYDNWKTFFRSVSKEQAGEMILFLLESRETQAPDLPDDPVIRPACEFMHSQMELDGKKYDARCEQASKNARKRWDDPGNNDNMGGLV